MPLLISDPGQGCRLSLKVRASAPRSQITGEWNGRLKISIAAPAEKGRANREIIDFLADIFRLPKRSVTIVLGELSDKKDVLVADVRADDVRIVLEKYITT